MRRDVIGCRQSGWPRIAQVIVELAWDIPRAEVVLMGFWMSSGTRILDGEMSRVASQLSHAALHVTQTTGSAASLSHPQMVILKTYTTE